MRRALVALILAFFIPLRTNAQSPRPNPGGTHLLKTAWGGSAPLSMYAPNRENLGCHSVAFAQVLFHHRLAPKGRVAYTCNDGTQVSEDFSSYSPKWDRFALGKDGAGTDSDGVRETARFIYSVAAIVRKDFGTDAYVDYSEDCHKAAIEAHFDCDVAFHRGEVADGLPELLGSRSKLAGILVSELEAGRPAGLYYTDRQGGGHAVVVDGYCAGRQAALFHVNFGWLGKSDGWYVLEEDLPADTKEIHVITITPRGDDDARETKDHDVPAQSRKVR